MRRRVEDGICEVDCTHADVIAAAQSGLPDESALRELARTFKAVAHPNRLRILLALDGRELCVCDIADVLGMSMSGTSQQLRALRDVGAIDYRTEGKLVYYTVTDPFLLELCRKAAAHLGHPGPKQPRKSKRSA